MQDAASGFLPYLLLVCTNNFLKPNVGYALLLSSHLHPQAKVRYNALCTLSHLPPPFPFVQTQELHLHSYFIPRGPLCHSNNGKMATSILGEMRVFHDYNYFHWEQVYIYQLDTFEIRNMSLHSVDNVALLVTVLVFKINALLWQHTHPPGQPECQFRKKGQSSIFEGLGYFQKKGTLLR